jgi:carboxypeptidase PM20D1
VGPRHHGPKISVIAILEGVEALLAEGFRPTRTVYLAFGHDEEVGGVRGAEAIAELLERRGAEPCLRASASSSG